VSDRSAGALDRRLAQAGHSAAAREEAIAALDRAGLLDDVRLAQSRAEQLARRGYGDAAIRADLRQRQISDEAAADAVAALRSERDRASHILEGQAVTPQLLRRLASRGFSRETLGELAAPFAPEA
jgi:SOS response regulatory protein OraA/RecX